MHFWKRSLRFTIRGVLLLTLVVAVALAVWRCRPSPSLVVEMTSRGTVLVEDKEVSRTELAAVLGRESARRNRWWMRGVLTIAADPDTAYQDCLELLELGRANGFEETTLSVREKGSDLPEPGKRRK